MHLATIKKNKYQLALESPKALEIEKKEALKAIYGMLSACYYVSGQTMPGKDDTEKAQLLQLLTRSIYDELANFSFLRIEEVAIALKNGVRGEYGEFFGINIKTLYGWLKGFQMDAKRQKAILDAKAAADSEIKPKWSKDEAEYEYRQTINAQFKAYKAGGPLVIAFPIMQYKDFETKGLVFYTNAEKLDFMAQAKQLMISKAKIRRLNPKSKNEFNDLGKEITRIESGQDNSTDKQKIKSIACELAIKKYYDSIQTLNF